MGMMKKIKFGTMEILGYAGIFLWLAVIFLRSIHLSDNAIYLLILGILPNAGAAWGVTMFGKWVIIFGCKQNYNLKKHLILCTGIVILAFVSEMVHHLFLNSPFDWRDMAVTILAQLIVIVLPIMTKDKHFSNYH